ncbi:MAG: hypothetical protein AAFX87_14405 [Bacteroidota bacterium]
MSFTESFKAKDNNELTRAIASRNDLSLSGKIALADAIEEREHMKASFREEYDALIDDIGIQRERIQNLEFLNLLGLKLQKDAETMVLKRSSSGNTLDVFAIIIGAVLTMLCFPMAIGAAFFPQPGSPAMGNAFMVILMLAAGIAGFLLFYKGLNRRLTLGRFELSKMGNNWALKRSTDLSTESVPLPDGVQFSLLQKEEKFCLAYGDDQNEKQPIYETEAESLVIIESMKRLVEVLNGAEY